MGRGAAAGSAARRMAAASGPLGDCNKCRGGAAAAERGVPWPRGPSRPLSAPRRGPGMGGWKLGLCRSGAGEISGLPAVEKGEPRKLGSPLAIRAWPRVRGARRGRVPGEQRSERNSAQDTSANVSFAWKYKCALKGIYISWLGEAVRIPLDFHRIILWVSFPLGTWGVRGGPLTFLCWEFSTVGHDDVLCWRQGGFLACEGPCRSWVLRPPWKPSSRFPDTN